MRKPILGEKLYLVNVGYRARYFGKRRECEVVKVGRKYFTVIYGGYIEVVFHVDTWRQKTDCSVDYNIYETEQQYRHDRRRNVLYQKLSKEFHYVGNIYTLEQLEAAAKALGLDVDNET